MAYDVRTAKLLRKHRSMAAHIRKAVADYASNPLAHANNVTELVGGQGKRMRVSDFRVIFIETDTEIIVVKIGPRGDVYD